MQTRFWIIAVVVVPLIVRNAVQAGESQPSAAVPLVETAPVGEPAAPSDKQQALFAKFRSALAGAQLVGRFTVLAKRPGDMATEEYSLADVTKLPKGDYWLFQTRMRYGNVDVTLPLPLEVKWAETTPVITLSDLTIPGLGTFSARVVIDDGKYAGTWRHGDASGHLFGEIKKVGSSATNQSEQP